MKNLSIPSLTCIIAVFCVAASVAASAQSFTGYDFRGTPFTSLVQGFDGNLYGTTGSGGANSPNGLSSVFRMTPTGTIKGVYVFCSQLNCADGGNPWTPLLLAPNGNFLGATASGGTNSSDICNTYGGGCGTIFEITPGGKLTTLHSFCAQANCADGAVPWGTLARDASGNLYGTTQLGGNCRFCGTVFKLTPAGQFTTLYSFCSQANCTDGANPYSGLMLARNGNLYGTTPFGGPGATGPNSGSGTVFGVTTTGTLATLYDFCSQPNCVDGAEPFSGLIQGSDGSLYGTNSADGEYNSGTAFRLSMGGELTTLHQFCLQGQNCTGGSQPYAALVQGSDGNFYGTTEIGGDSAGAGTIFELSPTQDYTKLYDFCPNVPVCQPLGEWPIAALVQATDGTFYGTTPSGGYSNKQCAAGFCGTVFTLANGLGPFVLPNPLFGKVGQQINILGNELGSTNTVTFNGVRATFSILSDTHVTATVPTAATTGTIEVTTPSGTLRSDVAFQILP
jgi:uncharacterized repeat protein (TIGR03803 family)